MDPAARHAELLATARRRLVQNYKQQPIVLSRGEGSEVWDVAGRRYLDMTAGIAVSALGHAHPRLTAAITAQAGRLLHVSNLYFNEQQALLADALIERAFPGRVFFCNSGAEANEAAIKLARRYQAVVAGAPERVTILATDGSFHGRSVATVSLTGQEKYRKNFGPLFGPVGFLPYGDLAAARTALTEARACALLVEPIQAEGGIIVPPVGYLAGLREACSETGTLLLFDEVQTGVGRTGRWFGHQHDGVVPDVMTLAKGLAGGVPIGAMVASEEAARGLEPLPGEPAPHASTFGGNPLACAAALAVLDAIDTEGLLARCAAAGARLDAGLAALVVRHPTLARGTRGRGLLRGLVVAADLSGIVAACREAGLLVSAAGPDVVRFVPPLVVRDDQVDEAVAILGDVLAARAGVAS
ncbi:MAG: acetylornithine/succinylornithine family transaminase [Myxococcales bacterium]|nr:acetylornithine/succinylornithine family transaminase [Myxococcales bacterium]